MVFSVSGILAFSSAMAVMPVAMGHVGTFPLQLPCVMREIRSGAYDAAPFYMAKSLTDIPVDIMYTMVLSGLILFLTGMAADSVSIWLKIWGVMMLGFTPVLILILILPLTLTLTLTLTLLSLAATTVGNAIGHMTSCVAPNPNFALLLTLLIVIPQFLFSGTLVNLDQIPTGWSWAKDLSVFRYLFEIMMQTLWEDVPSIPCDSVVASNGGTVSFCPFPTGEAVLDFYAANKTSPMWCVFAMVVMAVTLRIIGLLVLISKAKAPTSNFGGPPPDDATKETGMPSSEDSAIMVSPGKNFGRTQLPITLQWQDINLTLQVQDPDMELPPQPKHILSNLNGEVLPGELCAVMGASGSGKTCLLNCLATRQHEGVTGKVLFNGKPFTRALQKYTAYMHQEDIFIHEITPREHLLFHAR